MEQINTDIVNIQYQQTGASSATNDLGMREMQAKAYEARNKRFLLIKAPPSSGKSRALMFIALFFATFITILPTVKHATCVYDLFIKKCYLCK